MSDLFIKWAIPAACAAICGWLGGLFANRRKKRQNVENGVQCLLRLEIIRSYENYSHKGYCPVYAREALTKGYTAYHNLGGNDVATDLYDKILELPTDKEGVKV